MTPGPSGLESDSQSQTNGSLAEHTFLLETICQLAKSASFGLGVQGDDRRRIQLPGAGPFLNNIHIKFANLRERTSTSAEVGVGRKQGVIKNVIEIGSQSRDDALPDRK